MAYMQSFEARCKFKTERLLVETWKDHPLAGDADAFALRLVALLSEKVTRSLPPGWQDIDTPGKARGWIAERDAEGSVLAVQIRHDRDLIGFLFLNEAVHPQSRFFDLRLGYLLTETVWGQGLGSELINGLVTWCQKSGEINSLTGGVEADNTASIRVLEKNGFILEEPDPAHHDMVFMRRQIQTH